MYVQEEERTKKEEIIVNLVQKPQHKPSNFKCKKLDTSKPCTSSPTPNNLKPKKSTAFKCYFCEKEGHIRKNVLSTRTG